MTPSEPYYQWMENKSQLIVGILFLLCLILLIIGILIYHFRQYDKRIAAEERKKAEETRIKNEIIRKNNIEKRQRELAAKKQEELRLEKEKYRKYLEEDWIHNHQVESREDRVFRKGDPEYISNGEYRIGGECYVSVWKFKTQHNLSPNTHSDNGIDSQCHVSNESRYYFCIPDWGDFDRVKIFPYDTLYRHYFPRGR